MRLSSPFHRSLALSLALFAGAAWATPYLPGSDAELLETVAARASDPRMREMQSLRAALSRNPNDAALAVRLARRYYEETAAEGDPRYVGYAQAALAPWWKQADAPPSVLVMRAVLRQFNHDFDGALADLRAASEQAPELAESWGWQAAIHLVRADYAAAHQACAHAATRVTPLVAAACQASVDSVSGRAEAAADALRQALAAQPAAAADERLWALTRLAETEERRGRYVEAEAAFRQALDLQLADGYLLVAYADFLLDRQRPAEVLLLLEGKSRSDLLLLRLVLAGQALRHPSLKAWQEDLSARFDAARRRGDTTHEKEESRFALAVMGDSRRALELARRNYAVQREPADARVLLEAALAAREPAAATPVLQWMARSGIESEALQALATRLKAPSQ